MKTTREPGDCVLVISGDTVYSIPSNHTVRRRIWLFTRQDWTEWMVCDAAAAQPGDELAFDRNGARWIGEVQ